MKSVKNCRSSFLERKDAGVSNSPHGMVHTVWTIPCGEFEMDGMDHTQRKTGKDEQHTVSTPNAV